MPYGTIKIDTITFTDGGVDKSVPVSGLVLNPTFTGNVTVTGTISGNIIQGGTTVSGLTVTGTTVASTTGTFTSLTGTTATFTSGIIASGTASLPSLAILSDPNTGIFSPGADELAIATNGSTQLVVNSSGQVALNSLGSAATPAYSWIGDPNTGIYRPAADELAIATNGTVRLAISNSAVSSALPINVPLGAVGTPSLTFTSDLNTGIYSPGADQLAVATNGVERVKFGTTEVVFNDGGTDYDFRVEGDTNANLLFVDASTDRVGIGSSAPTGNLSFGATDAIINSDTSDASDNKSVSLAGGGTASTARGGYMQLYGNEYTTTGGVVDINSGNVANSYVRIQGRSSSSDIRFWINASEAGRFDTSGRLLIGTSSSPSAGSGQYARLVVQGYAGSATGEGIVSIQRGEAAAIIPSGGDLGRIVFGDNAGNTFAGIFAFADATPGASDHPGRLGFFTTADGASTPTERMRITSGGKVLINTISAKGQPLDVVNSGSVLAIDRTTSDGTLIDFYQDGTAEGSISVSGTTVSYNGAHLSRWSQIPSGAERIEILRGSVLSNLDEMCEWSEEDNEQLNRMKVSDVEGDKNVSGVFQDWDDDDDTYTADFYCAMTGDFIIRIAEGVTVERGDLLMSAGDGTAKPQGDDIIRSKTIAKVTSTNVSCTYDDGSYCVPCVLMAC